MTITPTLPTIREAFLPKEADNRPGVVIVPRYVTVHETANPDPGANAEMHRRYVHSGGGPQSTSYNFVVDDAEAVALVPIGESSNHAGTAPGNTSGIAIELCVNADGDWQRTLDHGAGLVARLYRTVPTLYAPATGLVNHGRWRATGCPARLRANGGKLWDEFVGAVTRELAGAPPPTADPTDAALEAQWQRHRAQAGPKRFAAELDRPYNPRSKVLVCERLILTPAGPLNWAGQVDDLVTYWSDAGVLRRY